MIGAFRSEWTKLSRWGVVLGLGGALVGFALLVTIVNFAYAQPLADTPPPQPGRGQGFPTIEALTAGGPLVVFLAFGQILGIVALVFYAGQVAAEYTNGTLKIGFVHEPRRIVYLSGKLSALSLFLGVGIVAAFLASVLAAYPMASARGIDTSAWFDDGAIGDAIRMVGRTWATGVAYGLLGTLFAVLFRAAAPAVGIGIAYSIVIEPLVTLVWSDAGKWLPGQALSAFGAGGTPLLDVERAGVLLLVYGAIFAITSAGMIVRRDVSS